jgi:hypothetical protein
MFKFKFPAFILLLTLDIMARHYVHSTTDTKPSRGTSSNKLSFEAVPLAEEKLPVGTIYLLHPATLLKDGEAHDWNDLLEFDIIQLT